MGTIRSTTVLDPGYTVNGCALGEPVEVDGVYLYADSRFPDGEIVDGVLTVDDPEVDTPDLLTPAQAAHEAAHAAFLALSAKAAAVAAAQAREDSIDRIPVLEEAVDELIVAVLAP